MCKVEVIDMQLHEDARGWVVYPVPDTTLYAEGITNLHIPLMKPGSIRGNHYHKTSWEYALVSWGRCRACFRDVGTGKTMEIAVVGNRPKLFKIPPNTIHAFQNQGQRDIVLVCYLAEARAAPSEDTCRQIIIAPSL